MVSIGRGSWIRTNDPLLPKQMRYQTALYPEYLAEHRDALRWRRSIVIHFGLCKGIFEHVGFVSASQFPSITRQKANKAAKLSSYPSKRTLTMIATTGKLTVA